MEEQPFRNPSIINELLSDKTKYNVFFVFTHGELVSTNISEGSFEPDDNNIIVSTGAGQPGCPVWVGEEIDQNWINLFDPKNIKQTFGILLGLSPGLEDLLYKVPGDIPRSPQYWLSYDESNVAEKKGIWGVFKHTGKNNSKPFDNVEKDEELSEQVKDGTFASLAIDGINEKYPEQTNIVFFGSCRSAFRGQAKVKHFAEASAPLFAATHFHTNNTHSGLHAHEPSSENLEEKPLRIIMEGRFDITLNATQRNVMLQELINAINEKFETNMQGLFILPIIQGEPKLIYLENEALLGGQLKKSYVRETSRNYILQVYPNYEKQNKKTRKSKAKVDPIFLERAEIQRRGNITKKRSKKRSI